MSAPAPMDDETRTPTPETTTDEVLARIAEIGVRRIEVTGGRIEMDLTASQEVMTVLAAGASRILDSTGAENYVEMQFRDPAHPGEMLTLTVQRWLGKTPHQKRQEAEAERDALRAQISASQALSSLPPTG